MTTAQEYLNETRERTGVKVTVTHLAIKALAEGLARCPTLNGKIVLGDYIPSPTVDIGCLVVLEREEGNQRVWMHLSLSRLLGCHDEW
jgi:pyruvate/2-oxoglutarate dehydrogenase complex dihydrolipoamide acyltransferase (E2) component